MIHFFRNYPSVWKAELIDCLNIVSLIEYLKRTFCVGTWNIRELLEIKKVLKRRNVDTSAFHETKSEEKRKSGITSAATLETDETKMETIYMNFLLISI